jgi:carbon-monoxide dehydrogenase small subunit
MTEVALTVNGEAIRADIAPRTHLADFLREQRLLTGTHLGCEHGVCGACTLLVDGAPARSCIAFAAACEGATVTTIEGLEHDPVMVALRAAFTAEHALQCGYCTPGMLVTARDIVLRLPQADPARIRLELAGNLCRCTGYAGIVRAIQRVLASPPTVAPPPPQTLPTLPLARTAAEGGARRESDGTVRARGTSPEITQTIRLPLPADQIWQALQNPNLIAACVPGATLTATDGNRVTGTLDAALGPIRARFAGTATLTYNPDRTGDLTGQGQDATNRLGGSARFAVLADGDAASTLTLAITYALRGPLAQFARGPVVQDFAAEIGGIFAANLQATLQGREVAQAPRLGLFALLWRVLRRRLGRKP